MLDVVLNRQPHTVCNGPSRRDFVRAGALAGLSLPALLRAEAHAGPGSLAKGARAKSVLLVYLGGGLSHHDSFDPKPDAPEEIRGKYGTIDTSVAGPAHQRDAAADGEGDGQASRWCGPARTTTTTTRRPPTGCCPAGSARRSATTRRSAPSSRTRPASRGTLPPYVAVPRNPSFTWELGKSAFLGGRYESFKAGDPNQPNYKVQDLTAGRRVTRSRSSAARRC